MAAVASDDIKLSFGGLTAVGWLVEDDMGISYWEELERAISLGDTSVLDEDFGLATNASLI